MLKKLFSRFSKKNTGAGYSAGTGGLQKVTLQSGSLYSLAIGFGGGYYNGRLSDYEAMSLYRQSSAVATAVDMIAQEIEHVKPVIRMSDGTLTDSHPVLDRLNDPNDHNESYHDFIGQHARNWLLTHNAYAFGVGTVSRPPLEIYAIKPQNVTIYENENDNYVTAFNVYRGPAAGNYKRERVPKRGMRYYDGGLKELWQTIGYSSRYENTEGDSPLLAICLEIYQQIRGRIHNVQLLENGARPSMVVTFKDDSITQDDFDARAQALREQMAGADNAGKIAITSADDTTLSEFGMNNRDMDFANLDVSARLTIFNRYNIPLPLVSNDASTFSNMENAVDHLYDFAVLPNLNKLLSSLSMWLLPRYGVSPAEMQITYNEEEIPALRSRRLKQIAIRREIGIETVNELREGLANREPLIGQDIFWQPATLVESGRDPFTEDNYTTAEERAQALMDRDDEE